MKRGTTYYCHQCQTYHGRNLSGESFGQSLNRFADDRGVINDIKTCSRCKQKAKRRKVSSPGKHNALRTIDKKRNKLSMLH